MAYAGIRLDNEQKDHLKDLVGKRLKAIHFSPCASEFYAWEWVWLEFEDCIVEVSNGLGAVEYYDPTEDVSVFRIRQVGLLERLAELNDGSYDVEDFETPRVSAL